jgi:trans-aconitate methyltransferase
LKLRGDETVLDAGCGTGRLTAELLESLPRGRVIGIDLSRNMLDTARDHLSNAFGSRLNLLACDLLQLPLKRVFNVVVSTAAFHWVLDHDQLFRNLHDVLLPGGWLEAQCGGGPNIARVRQRANELAGTPRFKKYFQNFREPWLYEDAHGAARKLENAGFMDVETTVQAAPTVLDNAAHYSEFLRNIVLRTHLEYIPTEEERDEFMAILTQQAAQDNPPFLLDYWRLNLRGRAA